LQLWVLHDLPQALLQKKLLRKLHLLLLKRLQKKQPQPQLKQLMTLLQKYFHVLVSL
jgi:hypothetical protein